MPNTSPRNSESQPGDLPVIPNHVVDSVLGRGAMSTVYLARQVDMDRPVAIKVMSDEVASRDDLVEQLLVEARIAASLNHPNIVRALDAGFANGRCYFVMEFIEGETLRDRIQRDGALPAAEVQALGISLASALNELDRHHLIHRDVKPANILLGEDGAVHLVDFGLACIELELSEGDSARTVGTPQYMSPEQIADPASVDIRSDLFSLGSTLSHALTGVCPFEAKGAGESLSRVLYETPLPLRDQGGGWPLGLCDVIDSLLKKDRESRCTSPAALLDALKPLKSVRSSVGNSRAWVAAALLCAVIGIGAALWPFGRADGRVDSTPSEVVESETEVDRTAALDDRTLFRMLCDPGVDATLSHRDEGKRRIEMFIGARRAAVSQSIELRSFDEAKRLVGDDLGVAFEARFGIALSEIPEPLFEVMSVLRAELDLVRRNGLAEDQDGLLNIFIALCDERAVELTRQGEWTTKESVVTDLKEIVRRQESDWELLLAAGRQLFSEYCEGVASTINAIWQEIALSELRDLERLLEGRLFRDVDAGVVSLRSRGVISLTGGWDGALARLSSEVDVARQGLGVAITVANDSIRLPRSDGSQMFEGRPVNGINLVLEPTVTLLPDDLEQLGDLSTQALTLTRLHHLVLHLVRGDTPEMPGQRALLAHLDGRFEAVFELVPLDEKDPLLKHIRSHSVRAHAVIHHVSSSVEQQAREHLQSAMTLMEASQWSEAALQLQLISEDIALQGTEWMKVFGSTVQSLQQQMTVRQSLVMALGQRRATVRILDTTSRHVQLRWEEEEQLRREFKLARGPYRVKDRSVVRSIGSETMDPSSMLGLQTTFPWKSGTRFVLSFTYEPHENQAPCLMTFCAFGLNTVLLSRLQVPARERSLPLHGWGVGLTSHQVFGWSRTFFGSLGEAGNEFLKTKLKRRNAFFNAGESYTVRFVLDDAQTTLTVTINGDRVHHAKYSSFRALDDRIRLLIPKPHRIRDIRIEGILREE